MKKILLVLALLVVLSQLALAAQQTFTGSVFNSEDGDLLLARVSNANFVTEITNGRYLISVDGNAGSEVQFWMKDHIIHRERLNSGTKPLDLDSSRISTQPLPPETEGPVIVTPTQPPIPPAPKKSSFAFWFILLFVILLVGGGITFYLYQNEWIIPFELPKFSFSFPWKRKAIQIPPRIPPRIPPKIELKIPPRIPPKKEFEESFEKPEELTPPKANGAQETIKRYVSSMKEKGFDLTQIKAALYARGWKRELIEQAVD